MDAFVQAGHDLRLEWGPDGVAELGRECGVLIVVDVLSFSTTVDLVTSRGGRVRPLRPRGDRQPRPGSVGPDPGLLDLPSPNGATLCVQAAGTGATVLAGCLRNATAVAAAAHRLAGPRPIGVIPAGERWGVNMMTSTPGVRCGPAWKISSARARSSPRCPAGRPRPRRSWPPSPTAAPTSARRWGSSSGRELIGSGHERDVELAAAVDVSTAPVLVDDLLEAA